MTMIVGKVVDNMAWDIVSPSTRWRVEMIIPILIIITVLGHVLIWMRPTRHTWLV